MYAKLIPAARSLKLGALPIGLAHRVKLSRNVAAGEFVTAADVALDGNSQAVRVRREMENAGAADDADPDSLTGGGSSVSLQHSDVARG